ncbi:MAG: M16 family metallopeptidase [Candidatus Kapaibacterium sp.]
MKRFISVLTLFLIISGVAAAQDIDLSQKPQPLPEKDFPFPAYSEKEMANGIKVLFVEDHEQPTVTFRLMIPGGTNLEGDKSGLAEMTAYLITKGAGDRKALDIAQAIDGVGASLNTSAGEAMFISASGLKKHMDIMLDVMSDVLLKPKFPEEEFDKLVKQMLTGIKNEKSDPSLLAANLSKMVVYGKNHPYGQRPTEKSINSITNEDVKNFYKNYFKPQDALLAVVGDVKASDIMPVLEEKFGAWEGDAPEINVPPTKPMAKGVYFVERPGSVQSSTLIATRTIPRSHRDYVRLDVAADIIGAGFAGRLFRTLRETYSYTYTPFGYLTSAKYTNRFACGADVRNDVTDSAIAITLDQLRLLASEPPSEEELNRIKRFSVGSYLMNFESSSYVASLIQNAEFHDIPITMIKEYPNNLMRITPAQVSQVARQYMNPDDAYIIVVGDPSVKEKIEKFGKVYTYNLDLEPADMKLPKAGIDADELMDKYINALGGKEKLDNIRTIHGSGNLELTLQGRQIPGTFEVKQKKGGKLYRFMDMGMMQVTEWVNSDSAWVKQGPSVTHLDGEDLDSYKQEAMLFRESKLMEQGYKLEVMGKMDSNIVMKAVSPAGKEMTLYFGENDHLLNKIEKMEDTPQGPMAITVKYEQYADVSGVKLPQVIIQENPQFTIKMTGEYKTGVEFEDSAFVPSEN